MRCPRAIPLAAAALALAIAMPGQAGARTRSFQTRSGDVRCLVSHIESRAARLRCDLRFLHRQAALLRRTGKARIVAVQRPLRRSGPVLRLGATYHFGPFVCVSHPATLSCRTKHGHGFTLGRRFQLVF
jgi:hypothetical protein